MTETANAEPSEAIASRVFAALSDRKGFDWWFFDLDTYLQLEIWDEMVSTVREAMADGGARPATVDLFQALREETA